VPVPANRGTLGVPCKAALGSPAGSVLRKRGTLAERALGEAACLKVVGQGNVGELTGASDDDGERAAAEGED